MIRWKYVAPRLGIIAMILAGVIWGTRPLLRWCILHSGQSAIGAKVEIGEVATDLRSGSLAVQRLAVTDPGNEFRNLFELDRAALHMDVNAALHKKFVVNHGHLDGLRFHTPRQESGRLPAFGEETIADEDSAVTSILDQAGQRGKAWFDNQLGNGREQLENDLQTVQLGRDLSERWPTAYEDLEQRARRIQKQSKRIERRIKAVSDDPLEHIDQIESLVSSIEQLGHEATAVQAQLRRLKQQMRDDREALRAAKDHDQEYLRERIRVDELDARSLTEYLLAPVWSERIGMAIDWLQRSRQAIPASAATGPVQSARRGIALVFPGFAASPDVLVRRLDFSGQGRVDDQPFTFTGIARDLTPQPTRHPRPASFELQSNGSIEFVARATLDRRRVSAVDQFEFDVPALRQAERMLGDPSRLALTLSPGIAKWHGNLTLRGDQLEGIISVRQSGLQLTPTLGAEFSEFVSPENLRAAVGGVDRLESNVTLSGSLAAPRYELQSNLGTQLAQGMNQAVRNELLARQQQVCARAHQEVEQRWADLQRDLTARHGKILSQLELGDEQRNRLKSQLLSQLGAPADLIGRGSKSLFK